MALIGMRDVRWGFGEPALLDGISFNIEKGERVGLLGRNGVGKSSLLRLLNREIEPDSGEIVRQQGIRVAALEQEVPAGCQGSVFEVVAQGLGSAGQALAAFHRLSDALQGADDRRLREERDRWQQRLDSEGGWPLQQQIESVL